MKIVIRKFMLLVMMTTAAAVAADSSSSSTLATKLAIEEEKSMLNNEAWATVTTTTTTPPEGFAASSSSSSLSASLLLSSSLSSSLSSLSSSSLSSSSSLVEVSGDDGSDVSAQRKLSKSSKKVKHPGALCTLSLFADSVFMYANQCYDDIMVTISACDDEDDTCYISERLPILPQEQEENQEEEQCFVGGSFPAKQNIRYNPSTGDCEFLYVDLTDDPCNLYTGDTGTGSLGLKARINVKNNPEVMFIQFTNDKGLTFYNDDDERFAVCSPTHNADRYLRQEGETKPVLSMMPHPFPSGHRRLYSNASVKNDTPYKVNWIKIKYSCFCAADINNFIVSGGTWTVGTDRGLCPITKILADLIVPDGTSTGRVEGCAMYQSLGGTGYSQFYIMWINGECCLRSWAQPSDKCIDQNPKMDPDAN